ncbi:NADH-ubiquinone oxidoreductase-F iron-sulfur binding region domain-containing protein [Cupriavidus gilardii]|uniref:NADH-quinone oxidoreductase subunit F n=1 Tax=Cupriavidus gilardii TaxID=82541 RepID=A0A849BBY3_9BURK|nr:NADH-ubiquinone oxidoreductase-F iron-sulfur binding region domain-containing protein [Cupriavidus gilardii]KAB0599300.1 NADH-quinone oxidoreductase subunit F [Cupriavidus gilardii]MCT9013231.1 NAD(P)H-dependent oxidoreductase subunit E [Cupriavidus gilardii]MCT9052785.1 NAD(P)H-dependent oxidoreductase subunit E [Cupriavidus gilardii]MCT9124409.1 NAD(P)H-dependent oxidoreductase subunit E [Cupriavidus gilardii]NNH12902.1 NADH-quinone oxidoreductase subunit F [Cupriavidus gilardii]
MNHVVIPIPVESIGRQRKRRQPKGRQVDPAALAEVRALLGDAPRRRDLLIEHLHAINDRYGQLAAPHLAALAAEMKMSQAEVYEVATFYHHFDVVREDADGAIAPPPALTVRVCEGIACEMAGAQSLLAKLPALLGTDVRVVAAPCIGRCERAPAALVGQNPVDVASAEAIAERVAAGAVRHEPEPYVDYLAYREQGGYRTLRAVAEGALSADDAIATMEHAGLRGLGGAGFPAGRKWRIVRAEAGPRMMAVNIDEGEPGTFKDRFYLERDPHRFIEGMLIAAKVVQVEAIYIYLRDEYAGCRALLTEELRRLREDPPCADLPPIELRRGAGAYICGEESAMIESIEGKRGWPRLRPPYVAQVGLFGRPTLEHNFETLYWVRDILERGAEWFAGQGRHGRKGLRSFSVSGRVNKPGVHLAPAGITITELIDEYCGGMLDGHRFYGYLPGGASGGILPASMGDIPLDFDTLQPHGCFIGSAAVVVLSDHDRAVDVARNLMHFFAHESCGQCTPCRVGTAKAVQLIAQPRWDREALADLSAVMRDASICGLGQAAPNPIDCVIRYFPHELA